MKRAPKLTQRTTSIKLVCCTYRKSLSPRRWGTTTTTPEPPTICRTGQWVTVVSPMAAESQWGKCSNNQAPNGEFFWNFVFSIYTDSIMLSKLTSIPSNTSVIIYIYRVLIKCIWVIAKLVCGVWISLLFFLNYSTLLCYAFLLFPDSFYTRAQPSHHHLFPFPAILFSFQSYSHIPLSHIPFTAWALILGISYLRPRLISGSPLCQKRNIWKSVNL